MKILGIYGTGGTWSTTLNSLLVGLGHTVIPYPVETSVSPLTSDYSAHLAALGAVDAVIYTATLSAARENAWIKLISDYAAKPLLHGQHVSTQFAAMSTYSSQNTVGVLDVPPIFQGVFTPGTNITITTSTSIWYGYGPAVTAVGTPVLRDLVNNVTVSTLVSEGTVLLNSAVARARIVVLPFYTVRLSAATGVWDQFLDLCLQWVMDSPLAGMRSSVLWPNHFGIQWQSLPEGKSAYRLAQDAGYTGTQAEWLESLNGIDGIDGIDGDTGPRGPEGPPGATGTGLEFRGPWSVEVAYAAGNLVAHADSVWIALSAVTGGAEPGIGTSWQEYAGTGGGGGGGGYAAGNFVRTSSLIAPGGYEMGSFELNGAEVSQVLRVSADKACRFRLYASEEYRERDRFRYSQHPPTGDHGVLLDVSFEVPGQSVVLSPAATVFNLTDFSGAIPYLLDNSNQVLEQAFTVTLLTKGLPGAALGGTDAAEYVFETAVLAPGATGVGNFTLSAAEIHQGLRLRSDSPCRVRFYASADQRDADESRPVGVDPVGDHGLLLDVTMPADQLSLVLTPAVTLFNASTFGAIPITITNTSGISEAVSVYLTAKGV